MEESEDSSIDPFAGLPCGPPASLTPLTEEELLRGIRDILPEYQEHSNFRNVREMNAAMEHFERMKRGDLTPSPKDSMWLKYADFGGPIDYGKEVPLNFTDDFVRPQNFTDDFVRPQNFTDDFGGPQHCPNEFGGPQNFTDDFGGAQDFDFGTAQFGDEEFGGDINDILQSEAPPEEGTEYPTDFPPQIDMFGPGFHWDAANLSEPSWPHSYPYGSVGGHDMSSKHHIAIDSSFDANLVSFPLNAEKLNSIRKKLSDISNDQYRQVIQMLQADCDEDQDVYIKLLRRVASAPYEDADSTLAPIPPRSPAKHQRSSSQSSRVSSPFGKSSPLNQPIDNLTSLAILAKSLNDSNLLNDSKNC